MSEPLDPSAIKRGKVDAIEALGELGKLLGKGMAAKGVIIIAFDMKGDFEVVVAANGVGVETLTSAYERLGDFLAEVMKEARPVAPAKREGKLEA